MTTAAAPSPKSPLAMMFWIERSSRWRVRLHSSTESSTATWSGFPRRWSEIRATPAAPATQPSPKIGTRRTSGLSFKRFMSRASIEGVARPVTDTNMSKSIRSKDKPASAIAARIASSPSSTATRIKASFLAKRSEAWVLLHRQGRVAAAGARCSAAVRGDPGCGAACPSAGETQRSAWLGHSSGQGGPGRSPAQTPTATEPRESCSPSADPSRP